jgi:hypothetical protein
MNNLKEASKNRERSEHPRDSDSSEEHHRESRSLGTNTKKFKQKLVECSNKRIFAAPLGNRWRNLAIP